MEKDGDLEQMLKEETKSMVFNISKFSDDLLQELENLMNGQIK